MNNRLRREKRTVYAMILMHCNHYHNNDRYLCNDCTNLWNYTESRLDQCMFGYAKPACSNCQVHCYKTEMRERIRGVMRYAGPRMILKHPWFAIMHIANKVFYKEDKVVKKIVKPN